MTDEFGPVPPIIDRRSGAPPANAQRAAFQLPLVRVRATILPRRGPE